VCPELSLSTFPYSFNTDGLINWVLNFAPFLTSGPGLSMLRRPNLHRLSAPARPQTWPRVAAAASNLLVQSPSVGPRRHPGQAGFPRGRPSFTPQGKGQPVPTRRVKLAARAPLTRVLDLIPQCPDRQFSRPNSHSDAQATQRQQNGARSRRTSRPPASPPQSTQHAVLAASKV
jgi:hypothetical protein